MKTQAMHQDKTMKTADYAILILVLSVLTFSVLNALITFPFVFTKHNTISKYAFDYASTPSVQPVSEVLEITAAKEDHQAVVLENNETMVNKSNVSAASLPVAIAAYALVVEEEPLVLEGWMTDPAVWSSENTAGTHPVNMEIIKEMMEEEKEIPLKLAPWMLDEKCFPSPDTRVK